MGLIFSKALNLFAQGVLTSVIGPFVEEAREAAVNAAHDTIRGMVSGRMSIEEWASIVIEGVDKVKNRAVCEENLSFIGGKLKFSLSDNKDNISVCFQLYFQDELEKWRKAEASNDIPVSKFTHEALEEIKFKGELVYEVE